MKYNIWIGSWKEKGGGYLIWNNWMTLWSKKLVTQLGHKLVIKSAHSFVWIHKDPLHHNPLE
jgi:hypothetical protein